MLLHRLTRTTASSRLFRPSTSFVNHNNFALSQSSLRLRAMAAMSSTVKDATVSDELISHAIIDDHRKIIEAYNQILSAPDDDGRTRWQNNFVWELARHSVAEELVLYPEFEKHLGEKGKEMAAQDRAEHQQVKEVLKHFESMKSTHPDFISTVTELVDNLKKHIEGEEQHDLPALENVLSPQQSASISRAFDRRKIFAPSRAHAWAGSEGGAFETVAGLFAAPIDHLADMLRKQPDHTISPNPSTK